MSICEYLKKKNQLQRLFLATIGLLTVSGSAMAIDANQIRLLGSDNQPVLSASGISVSGYLGNSHRCYATFSGDGVFTFPDDVNIDNAKISKNYITSTAQDLGGDIALVDFHVQVISSSWQGGDPINTNHGLSLYQNTSHKAYFSTPQTAGEYHIDVVPGASVRAKITKDYISDFTATVNPSDTNAADLAYQLDDFHVEVLSSPVSGGTPVNTNHGLSIYVGTSHKQYFATPAIAGQYHIDVVKNAEVRAKVSKDYISDFTSNVEPGITDSVDLSYQLEDFHVEVLSSPYRGGEPVSTNHGVSLYKGTSHKQYFPTPSTVGEYHIDVVRNAEVRAKITKDYIAAFTENVRPGESTETDMVFQLVDFCINLNTLNCDSMSLGSVSLYKGNSHKAYFSFTNPVRDLHHDVVTGSELRAKITRNYISVYTEAVYPGLTSEADVDFEIPTLRIDDNMLTGGNASLYQGGSHKAYISQTETGVYHIPVLSGAANLFIKLDGMWSESFTVNQNQVVLLSDARFTITGESSTCEYEDSTNDHDNDTAAIELESATLDQTEDGEISIVWNTSSETSTLGFRITRNGVDLDTLISAAGSLFGAQYSYIDSNPESGQNNYEILQIDNNGNSTILVELQAENSEFNPISYALNNAWPNPFNPVTNISFELPETMDVSLRVFTITGQLVATLVNEQMAAGSHQVTFDATNIASGVYISVLESALGSKMTKMTLIK
jgi:hypothetical protein